MQFGNIVLLFLSFGQLALVVVSLYLVLSIVQLVSSMLEQSLVHLVEDGLALEMKFGASRDNLALDPCYKKILNSLIFIRLVGQN